jgi:hypothetical protein
VARGALVAAGAIFIAAGGAAIGYALTRGEVSGDTPEWRAQLGKRLGSVDKAIQKGRLAALSQAAELASNARLESAIDTDAGTIADMFEKNDVAHRSDQMFEVASVDARKAVRFVVTIPKGWRAIGHPGERIDADTGAVEVTAEHAISRGGVALGYVRVTTMIARDAVAGELHGLVGRLYLGRTTNGAFVPIGDAGKAPTVPIESAEATFATIVPPTTGGMPKPIAMGGAAGAAFGLLLVIVGLLSGGSARKTAIASSDLGHADTRLSGGNLASGTPVDGATGADPRVSVTPSQLGPGAMLGRWEIVRRIGSGGMADVYLARAKGEAGFEKLVALKVMHAHLARNDRAVAHFLDEARLAARVVHPNVVAIQDLGKIGDEYVIVMEFVDGVDLERLLASARGAGRLVPIDVGLGILSRICDGLAAAHAATAADGSPLNIIHRDVKSANVLVSRQGGVKVVDFGIAKAAQQEHMTIAGETKGTPSMMAPEQRVGEAVDVRADVYAVAAVGYEILTGRGVNLDLAALAHLGIDNWPHLPAPSSLRAELPPELDEMLLSAMAYDREKRPADCATFEDRFAALMKKHGYSATDKDLARWVATEIELLVPPLATPTKVSSKPAAS